MALCEISHSRLALKTFDLSSLCFFNGPDPSTVKLSAGKEASTDPHLIFICPSNILIYSSNSLYLSLAGVLDGHSPQCGSGARCSKKSSYSCAETLQPLAAAHREIDPVQIQIKGEFFGAKSRRGWGTLTETASSAVRREFSKS